MDIWVNSSKVINMKNVFVHDWLVNTERIFSLIKKHQIVSRDEKYHVTYKRHLTNLSKWSLLKIV